MVANYIDFTYWKWAEGFEVIVFEQLALSNKTFETLFLRTKILFSSVYGVGYWMFSLNDCLWLSEDADIFEEQQSKKKNYYFNVYDPGDCMFHLHDCLCLLY